MRDERKLTDFAEATLRTLPDREKDIRAFLAYWNSMRHAGDLPRRSDIDPRSIEPLLEYAFIAERVSPGQARFRIAGTHLSDLMGMEVRGMPVSCLIAPESRAVLSDHLVELFEAPAVLQMRITSKGGARSGALRGALVMLPLRSDLGDVSRALGCLVTTGPVVRAPCRFDIDEAWCQRIETDIRLAPKSLEKPEPALSRSAPRHPSERPYLRVVK